MNIVAQLFGINAIACWVFSIQNKDKQKILIYQMFANALYFLQYFLLGAMSAAFMNLTSTIRSLVFYNDKSLNKNTGIYSFIFFCLIIIIIGILTFNSVFNLIPIIITLFYTYSVWQNNLKITRLIFICAAFIWIFYNIKVGAYISIIGNLLEIISGIYALIRFKRS